MSVTNNTLTRISQLIADLRDFMDRVLSELSGLSGFSVSLSSPATRGVGRPPHVPPGMEVRAMTLQLASPPSVVFTRKLRYEVPHSYHEQTCLVNVPSSATVP